MGNKDWGMNQATSVTLNQLQYFASFHSALNKRVQKFRHQHEKDFVTKKKGSI